MRYPRMAGLWARRELQHIMGRQELRLLIEIFHRAIKELQSKAPQRVVPEKGQTASECRRSLYITSDLILTTTLSSLCFHPPFPPPPPHHSLSANFIVSSTVKIYIVPMRDALPNSMRPCTRPHPPHCEPRSRLLPLRGALCVSPVRDSLSDRAAGFSDNTQDSRRILLLGFDLGDSPGQRVFFPTSPLDRRNAR